LSALVRQAMIFCDTSYRLVSSCTGTVTNSPPVGAGAVPPACDGMGMMPYAKPVFLAFASCHVPFSPNANLPVANSCQLVVWVLLSTELGAYPCLSQSVQSVSACTPCAESSWVRPAPAPQNQGRNWKLPSSVPIAENVMPFWPAAFTFCRAAVSVVQSLTWAGSTPALVRRSLL
jgi:hypothetical protein